MVFDALGTFLVKHHVAKTVGKKTGLVTTCVHFIRASANAFRTFWETCRPFRAAQNLLLPGRTPLLNAQPKSSREHDERSSVRARHLDTFGGNASTFLDGD